jgi:hypothetical protein
MVTTPKKKRLSTFLLRNPMALVLLWFLVITTFALIITQ